MADVAIDAEADADADNAAAIVNGIKNQQHQQNQNVLYI